MTFRDKLAINIAPIPLRLALAIVFITAGSAKLWVNNTYTPEQTAIIANMGVDIPAPGATKSAPTTPADTTPEAAGEDAGAAPQASAGFFNRQFYAAAAVSPAQGEGERGSLTNASPAATTSAASAKTYTAADFPAGTSDLKRFYMVALMLESNGPAHHPKVDDPATPENEATKFPLVPQFAAEGEWPHYLAIAAAWTEFLGGIMILLGLLTRFWALGLVGVMSVALWLTSFGPAINTGETILWIIPKAAGPWYEPASYEHLFYQLVLWFGAVALFCTGGGTLSLDRLLFGRSGESSGGGEDDDD